jgi:PAS domain S-box-containing protein
VTAHKHSAGEALRVLVVEHDAADVDLNLAALARGGFAVAHDVVATSEEFARCLRARPYDVVVADYRLPNWTGMDAFMEMRSLGIDTPLILVTGTLGDERAVDCVKQGVSDYILKENLARLPMAVHRALDERRARMELADAATQRHQAMDLLRERDERFVQLADTINEVFFLVDSHFRHILYINRAWEVTWGRPRSELYENPGAFLDAVVPDDLAIVTDNIRRVQGGEYAGEIVFRIHRPDGSLRWVRSHAMPIRDAAGHVYRISGVVLDITQEHDARLAVAESEARLRKLSEATFDAIVVTRDGVLAEVNRGFVDTFGLAGAEEAIGRGPLDYVAPESRESVSRHIADGLESTYQFVGLRADGKKIVLEATARSHVVDGRPGRLTALRNITEQRALEDQFRQAQKMEAMGRLAGGVAHDFNNLLTVITSYAEFLHQELTAGDPRRDDVEQIRTAAVAAASLTRQLLAFSRQQVIQPRVVALADGVRATEKMLRRVIGEDIDVVTVLSDVPLLVTIDAGQLEQVIMNLAVNARDAMPTGGKLTIETAVAELDQSYADTHWPATAGTYAMLALSDTGIGMDEATRARIFEPFFTTKEIGKGTGLGLASVYGIVKQAGGFVWVYSEPGQGATFKIYLPLVTDAANADGVTEAEAPVPRGTETILLVDDSAPLRSAVRQSLTRLGYVVLEAASGRIALTVAAQEPTRIDLLLTDVVMPNMSGRELAVEFAALGPPMKVLFMSGYTDDSILRHGILMASVEYIQKPFTPEALARKVRSVLDTAPPTAASANTAPRT